MTVVQATPTTFEMMLATGWSGDEGVDFMVGGEAFRPSLGAISRRCRSFRNVYGPTETTIWSSSYNIPRIPAGSTMSMPVGKPISEVIIVAISASSLTPLTHTHSLHSHSLMLSSLSLHRHSHTRADAVLPGECGGPRD